MLIAQKKKSENIAEYILYMYNVEDILRMFLFNIPEMMEKYVKPQLPDISFLNQYESWYDGIAYELQQTGKEKKGHISELQEATMELVYLHQTLLTVVNDEKYKKLSEATAMYLEEFRKKAGMLTNHEVEIILHAMNMKLQLKIRGKEISQETEEAFDCMRIQLAYLSREFHRMKSGNWQFSEN
jgi:hypothetical protein